MSEEEKLFYTIGEAAQKLEVKPYVLRYWESEFKKLNPQKSETGQRTYRKKDVQVAATIKRLLYQEKYTIAGAIQKLDELERVGFDAVEHLKGSGPILDDDMPEIATSPAASPVKKVEPPTPIKKEFPTEKLKELQDLLGTSYEILKKYQLN